MPNNASEDSEIIYSSLFENSLDGLAYHQMIFDEQGYPDDFIFLQINKNFEKLSGLKNVVGKKVTEVIPGIKISNPELFQIFSRVSLTGRPEKFETYIKPLGEWFLISVYSPKRKYFVTTFQNITDRKQTEKDLANAKIAALNVLEDLEDEKNKLAEAKAKDDALLESIGDGVVATDQQGLVIFVNRVAENLLGFTSAELVGKKFEEVILIKDNQGKEVLSKKRPINLALSSKTVTPNTTYGSAMVTATSSSTKTIPSDYIFVRQNGTEFPVAINSTPVILESKIAGAIIVFRDITREKEIEHAKSEFISIASHQLRTPVSGMSWLVEELELGAKDFPSKQKKYVDDLSVLTKRLVILLEDLLNFSRIELKTEALTENEKVEIRGFLKDFVKDTKKYADLKKHKIIFKDEIGASLVMEINKKSILNVLQNLIFNAIDYSPTNTGIGIILEKVEGFIKISVTNKDHTIPIGDRPHIFDRFYRSEWAKKIKPEGTGLGLYIVKTIIERIGGHVGFISEENGETVFWFTIPIISSS